MKVGFYFINAAFIVVLGYRLLAVCSHHKERFSAKFSGKNGSCIALFTLYCSGEAMVVLCCVVASLSRE